MNTKNQVQEKDAVKYGSVKGSLKINEKLVLSIQEASEYSNIGINTIESLLRQKDCPFCLYVGRKRLVKRKEFEEYIASQTHI